jgi:hypothetical protein
MADLCAVYPLMDAHVGMMAWGRETGAQDYDLGHAAKDMRHAFAKVLAMTPAAEQAILLIGGDYFHSDDTRSETPANRHKLDVTICGQEQTIPMLRKSATLITMIRNTRRKQIKAIKWVQGSLPHLHEHISGMSSMPVMKSSRGFLRLISPGSSTLTR